MNVTRMVDQLILHEGYRMKPYLDTEGFLTVGVGYNLSARGVDFINRTIGTRFATPQEVRLSREQAVSVLKADIARIEKAIPGLLPEYTALDEVRQRVVVDMAFNLGRMRALGFKKAIAALKVRNWSACAKELYASKWADQVGDGPGQKYDRADRLADMILTGNDYTK
jgi:lysozyme